MVAIDALFEFARTFEVKDFSEAKVESAAKIYRKTLIELPPDLLELAISRIMASHKFGVRMPLPKEIRDTVKDELHERSRHRTIINAALKYGQDEPQDRIPPSEEDKAKVTKIVEDVKRALKADDADV